MLRTFVLYVDSFVLYIDSFVLYVDSFVHINIRCRFF
jgi:hypothetical protein